MACAGVERKAEGGGRRQALLCCYGEGIGLVRRLEDGGEGEEGGTEAGAGWYTDEFGVASRSAPLRRRGGSGWRPAWR